MDKTPLSNPEAEKSILGWCIMHPEGIIITAPLLKPEDFFSETHRRAYTAMLEMSENSILIDMVSLSEKLRGKVDPIKIMELANFTSFNPDEHIKIIQDTAYMRRFVQTANLYIAKAYERDFTDVGQFKSELEEKLLALNEDRPSSTHHIKQIISAVSDDIEKRKERGIKGIKTYLDSLDAYLSGLQPSDLMIIAARPSMGKTALGLQIALNNSINKRRVYFVTLEMSKEQLVERMIINQSGINGRKLKMGDLTDIDYTTLANHCAQLYNTDMVIDELSNTVAAIRAQARKLKATTGLNLIVVDYLQYMEGIGNGRTEQVSAISRGLKQIARETKVPVIALSQLNRANESRKDKRPMLSDLRESGAIEQDADIVLFIHREDYYREKEGDEFRDGMAELILAKHRNGPTGKIECRYMAETMRFYHDWVKDAQMLENRMDR